MYTTNVYVPWGYINLTVNCLLQHFVYFNYAFTRRQYIELIDIVNSLICDIL